LIQQNAAFDKLLNPDSQKEEPVLRILNRFMVIKTYSLKEDVQRIDVDRDIPVQQMPMQEDPVVKMFRGIRGLLILI
jgi:hypothetical protein